MGSCYSKKRKKKGNEEDDNKTPPLTAASAAPPPPLILFEEEEEEETVKEVLSEETPNPSSLNQRSHSFNNKKPLPPRHPPPLPSPSPSPPPPPPPPPPPSPPILLIPDSDEDFEQLSQIYTHSDTLSAATFPDLKMDDSDDATTRFFNPNARGLRPPSSPARRPPPRGNSHHNRPWVPAGANAIRRDSCDISSGRRSRSPAKLTDRDRDLARCPSFRKTAPAHFSPKRLPLLSTTMPSSDLHRKLHDSPDRFCPPPANESLENPLVSLECFIFL